MKQSSFFVLMGVLLFAQSSKNIIAADTNELEDTFLLRLYENPHLKKIIEQLKEIQKTCPTQDLSLFTQSVEEAFSRQTQEFFEFKQEISELPRDQMQILMRFFKCLRYEDFESFLRGESEDLKIFKTYMNNAIDVKRERFPNNDDDENFEETFQTYIDEVFHLLENQKLGTTTLLKKIYRLFEIRFLTFSYEKMLPFITNNAALFFSLFTFHEQSSGIDETVRAHLNMLFINFTLLRFISPRYFNVEKGSKDTQCTKLLQLLCAGESSDDEKIKEVRLSKPVVKHFYTLRDQFLAFLQQKEKEKENTAEVDSSSSNTKTRFNDPREFPQDIERLLDIFQYRLNIALEKEKGKEKEKEKETKKKTRSGKIKPYEKLSRKLVVKRSSNDFGSKLDTSPSTEVSSFPISPRTNQQPTDNKKNNQEELFNTPPSLITDLDIEQILYKEEITNILLRILFYEFTPYSDAILDFIRDEYSFINHADETDFQFLLKAFGRANSKLTKTGARILYEFSEKLIPALEKANFKEPKILAQKILLRYLFEKIIYTALDNNLHSCTGELCTECIDKQTFANFSRWAKYICMLSSDFRSRLDETEEEIDSQKLEVFTFFESFLKELDNVGSTANFFRNKRRT